jgi:tricorn protease interacting factor F2/3
MKIKKYFLDYDFNLKERFFDGKVIIDLELNREKYFFDLDAKDLEIKEVKVNGEKRNFKFNKDKLRILGKFKKQNQVEIDFRGKLIEKLSGIYLSKYKEKEEEKYIITTQFEPNYAKTAFPCIDHPAYKAIFSSSFKF